VTFLSNFVSICILIVATKTKVTLLRVQLIWHALTAPKQKFSIAPKRVLVSIYKGKLSVSQQFDQSQQ